jgi:hypothetical protein
MDIEEIKRHKKQIEKEIKSMLVEFQKETGTRLSGLTLEIDKQYAYNCTGIVRHEVVAVILQVEI